MNNKIKLYIFHPYSKIGGADTSISRLINNLGPEYVIDFLCLGKNNLKLNKKIKILEIKSSRTIFSFRKIRKYLIADKKNKYKKYIFLSNQNFANITSFIILINLRWIKKIFIERNHIDEFKYNKSLKNFIIKILMKLLYKRADKIIGISKQLSLDLSKLCDCKVQTIYNPAYDKSIYKLQKKKNPIEKYKSMNILLNVARLEDQKDQITLLKAFKIVEKKFNLFLIIIGYGSKLYELKKYIKFNNLTNKVKIITNVSNPYNYFANSDLFVLTSRYEGFANVLVEAAMFNLPIISTNCNSGPREILLNGKGGFLVKVGDFISLAKKISYCIVNKKKVKKKRNNLKSSLPRFSARDNINKYEQIFQKI